MSDGPVAAPASPPTRAAAVAPSMPPMESRRVRLRPISDADRGFLYRLMTAPEAGGRVRFGGATPSPEKVAASLWESVLAQFVIEGKDSGDSLGLVAITSPNFRNRHCYLSALGEPRAQGTGLVAEGVFLGCNYAFLTWPLHKVYMESSEESFHEFRAGLGEFFQEEGRLREHVFWNGRFLDVLILAIYRDTWARLVPRYGRRLLSREAATELESRAAG